jgi:outer membrane protein
MRPHDRLSFVTLLSLVLLATLLNTGVSQAEDWKWESGGAPEGKWMAGMRAGFSVVTQSVTSNSSTDVGSAVNFHWMYGINKFFMVGLMTEWERRAIDQERPKVDVGHQDTVSVLPTVEVRPGRLGPVAPYASMGFGVNVNSFGESRGIGTICPSNTFAWRLAWGADYFLTRNFALNTEMAYKRNDGHVTINGVRDNDWNVSSFNFLFGIRAFF